MMMLTTDHNANNDAATQTMGNKADDDNTDNNNAAPDVNAMTRQSDDATNSWKIGMGGLGVTRWWR
jgi:hypothetical protein